MKYRVVASAFVLSLGLLVGKAQAEVGDGAVALCRGQSKAECTYRCSGVLIAPNLIVTARHCARDAAVLEARCDEVIDKLEYFAPDSFWVTSATTVTPQAAFARGKGWVASDWKSSCGNDVALLELDTPLAGLEDTFAMPRFANEQVSNGLILATYGPTAANDAATVGKKKLLPSAANCIGGLSACTAVVGGDTLQLGEILMDRTTCQGNSGSPLLTTKSAKGDLVGIVSRGIQLSEGCGYGITSSLGPHALLLARAGRQAAENGKYAVPAWVEAAEKRGNSDTFAKGEIGMPCDVASECKSNTCRSRDGGQTFLCTRPCETEACPTSLTCAAVEGGKFCFLPTKDETEASSSCAAMGGVGLGHGGAAPWAALVSVGLVAVAFRRKKS